MTPIEKVYLVAFTPLLLIVFGIWAFRLFKHFRKMR